MRCRGTPLPIGTWGQISTSIERTDEKGKPVSYRSKARFRDHDGHVRPVTAFGKNKTTAERAVLRKLQEGTPTPPRPPNSATAVLRTRQAAGIRLDNPVFADTLGGFRDRSNTRRSLRTALSPVGNTVRRDLGVSLRALRRETAMTRKHVADHLGWPQSRIDP